MPPQLPTPDFSNLNDHFLLGEIIDHIDLWISEFPLVNIPLLKAQINDIRNHQVDPETHIRTFLKIYRKTNSYQRAYAQLDEGTKKQIDAFIAGGSHEILALGAGEPTAFHLPPSPPVKHHFKEMIKEVLHLGYHDHGTPNGKAGPVTASSIAEGAKVAPSVTDVPVIYEDKTKMRPMEVHIDAQFNNWGLSVQNTPRYTFVPKTVLGLSNLVLYAKVHNFRVRVGGYRHSWSSSFSEDREILVSMLNLEEVTKIPDPMSIEEESIDPTNELKTIQVLETVKGSDGAEQALVNVGAAVTNEQLRRWCVQHDKWSLPVDVILVE